MRTFLLASFLLAGSLSAQSSDSWSWSGALASGKQLDIRNLNGAVRAEASSGSRVEITAAKRARKGSVDAVEIRVEETADGITICALWPSQAKAKTGCATENSGGRKSRDWDSKNEVTVDFTVKVPRGVRLTAATVNGDVEAAGLSADADVSSVNGDAKVQTSGIARAATVNGDVIAELGRADWRGQMKLSSVNGGVTVRLPSDAAMAVEASTVNGDIETDFPMQMTGRIRRQTLRGTIGEPDRRADRALQLSTVNGSIRIEKS